MLLLPALPPTEPRKGLTYLEILIPLCSPSCMVLSAFVNQIPLVRLGRRFEPITRFLFRLPGCTGATILISMISRLPLPGRAASRRLSNRGDRPQAGERMPCFTVGAGPAFVISVVGAGPARQRKGRCHSVCFPRRLPPRIWHSRRALFTRGREETISCQAGSVRQAGRLGRPGRFSADSAGAMNMCAFVVLFSSLIGLIQESGVGDMLARLSHLAGRLRKGRPVRFCPFCWRVTGGCANAARRSLAAADFPCARLGGRLRPFQISASLAGIRFSKLRFPSSVFFTASSQPVSPYPVFSCSRDTAESLLHHTEPLTSAFSSHAPGSVALVFTCAFFLSACAPGGWISNVKVLE